MRSTPRSLSKFKSRAKSQGNRDVGERRVEGWVAGGGGVGLGQSQQGKGGIHEKKKENDLFQFFPLGRLYLC